MSSAALVMTGTLRGTGFATRITSMISAYADAGLEIDLYHFRFPHEETPSESVLRAVSDYITFEMRTLRNSDHLRRRPAVMTRVNETCRQRLHVGKSYDLVQAEMTNVWGAANRIPGSRRVLVFHDDDWTRYKTFASSAPNPAYWMVARLSAARYRREQDTAIAQADMCWFVSREELHRLCPTELQKKCHLVPNGADEAFFSVPEAIDAGSQNVVFVGPPLYEANARSIAWFLDNIWSDIVRERPRARLRLIGSGWEEWLGEPRPQIETPGFVADLPAELNRATVVIAPLVSGGGTKIKILEAMAASRPIVCTSIAAAGIPRTDGTTVVDEPDGFAAGVRRWLNDPQDAVRGGRTNRDAVQGARWTTIWKVAIEDVLGLVS